MLKYFEHGQHLVNMDPVITTSLKRNAIKNIVGKKETADSQRFSIKMFATLSRACLTTLTGLKFCHLLKR